MVTTSTRCWLVEGVNTMGRYRCPGCDYTYDEQRGDAHEGYPPGTPFESLPEEFTCPDCAVRYKEDFVPVAE
jgi:rubredoxin